MPDALTHGSLFAGMGGLDLAIADVFGATTAWVSEWDAAPSRVLAHHYPDAPNLGDVTRVDWATVAPVDIISGGSPCQDLSHAGRRAGMTDGTRSNLWVAMREAIAVLKPTYVVWENVRGAMSAEATSELEHCPGCMGDPRDRGPVLRALGRVLGDLADLGFDAEWHGVRAADVGACHGRWRVFVLAYARGIGGHEALQHDGRGAAPTHRAGVPNERDREPLRAGPDGALALQPTPTSNLGDNGGPQHPDKRRAGGHSVSIEDAVRGLALLPTPRADEGGGNGEVEAQRHSPGLQDVRTHFAALGTWGQYTQAIARHERLAGRPAPEPTEPGAKGQPRLSARFVEWMMCLPDGWVTDVPGITRNEALRALGNGVVPMQAAHALHLMLNRSRGAA